VDQRLRAVHSSLTWKPHDVAARVLIEGVAQGEERGEMARVVGSGTAHTQDMGVSSNAGHFLII